MKDDEILKRTREALGQSLVDKLKQQQYCVVGCGGTGALFAEMLVRTGAQKITLIDGDTVDGSNLNRVISFVQSDIGCKKVEALESRLKSVNTNICVTSISCHLREHDCADPKGGKARDAICDSDVVIVAMDKNKCRIVCEELCLSNDPKKKVLSIGVHIDADGVANYECTWRPKTPIDKEEEEGYGIGSYASIVIEATAVAFTMLLHHLENPDSNCFKYWSKSYKNFTPETVLGNSLL